MDRYINPFIDYGFKKLFATEANKDLLISFLNAIIDDTDDPIRDLTYKNVEQIGEFNGTRANYFDVYCETHGGRQFIVEMQNSWKPYFKDRTIYYAAKPIRDQGLKEVAESDRRRKKKNKEESKIWDYRLNEVYIIAVMNFTFPKKEYNADSYFHKVMLSDIDDHHVFYDKLALYYLEMPKLDNIEIELKTPRDKWLYALYHLWRYDEYPEELDEDIFHRFYEQAEFARFTPAQQLTYERSRKVYLDTYNEIEGGRILGREQGLMEGREQGLMEGREQGLMEGREQGLIEGREQGLIEGREQGLAEGKEQGLMEGREIGMKLGLAEGKELGLAEGKELGLAEGKRKSKLDVARKLKNLNMDPNTILEVTGLTQQDLEKIT